MRIEEYIYDNSIKWNDKIAAHDNYTCITYVELLTKANQIAIVLKSNGVQRGDRVCIISERDIDGLTIVLAILFTGAIYVPISKEYPAKRKAYIINDCNPKLIISQDSLDFNSNSNHLIFSRSHIIQISTQETQKKLYCENLSISDIAYILYTSGSSGYPKGVMISHQAAMNTLKWMIGAFNVKEDECIPQKTAWGFTDSIWELFLPLMLGGRIGFITDDEVKDPIQLYNKLNDMNAVITQFVPPALSVFLNILNKEVENPKFSSLRWVLNGGEELPRKLVDIWFEKFPEIGYANPYGMTESAIYATSFLMKERPVWGMRRIPIGVPIDNEEVYILSEEGKILNVEEEGEICIGGESLMTGYWGQDELTKKVLISHSDIKGLIYKTGDYGLKRSDGLFIYIGRNDDQVNIRGMRVELSEVKRVVLESDEILEAAILLKGEKENKYLIAFYKSRTNKPLDSIYLFSQARNGLPEFMVPSYFVHLQEFPLTEHNKVDYRTLKNMKLTNEIKQNNSIQSNSLIEKELIEIWEAVLSHNNFKTTDAFFNVGGNSLLIMDVYSRLSEEFRNVLKLSDLIEYPTIISLSNLINVKTGLLDEKVNVSNEIFKKVSLLSKLKNRRNTSLE